MGRREEAQGRVEKWCRQKVRRVIKVAGPFISNKYRPEGCDGRDGGLGTSHSPSVTYPHTAGTRNPGNHSRGMAAVGKARRSDSIRDAVYRRSIGGRPAMEAN